MTIELSDYLMVSAAVFAISIAGMVFNRRHLIMFLMCIELLLLSVNINFIAFSHYLSDISGQIFVFFVLTVAAAETAIGLAILVVLYRRHGTICVEKLNSLKG
jgi:NADH-quinone oxidoreductase subunit K